MEDSKKTTRILIISILSLVLVHIALLFSIYYLPHIESYRYNSYLLTAVTGDDLSYQKLAKMVYDFDFMRHDWTLGFPITLVPFIYFFGENFLDIFVPVVVFNGFFLYSVAIALVVWTSFLVFKKIWPSVLSGFLFLTFPFIFYILRDFGPHYARGQTWNDFNFLHANWLTAQSDSLSAFLTIVILALLIYGMSRNYGVIYYGFLGFLSGFAMMTRLSNIVFILIGIIAIFLYKRYGDLISYIFFSVVGFLPQLIYNAVILGSPFKFGYQSAYVDWVAMGAVERPAFSIANITHLISRAVDYSWLAIPAFLLIFGVVFLGALYLYRINKKNALILAFWFILPTLFYTSFTSGQTTMRYYLPAVVPFIILSVAAVISIPKIKSLFRLQRHI